MPVVVISHADPASLNIREALLAAPGWAEHGLFDAGPVRVRGSATMVEIAALHLDADGLDARLAAAGLPVDALVFASKHKSAAGRASFTVHPVGNWTEAEHGGRAREFSPAPARLMAALLRGLAARVPKGVEVTYESTHHGPLVGAPTCFLEIGSDEAAWADPANGRLVAAALLDVVGGVRDAATGNSESSERSEDSETTRPHGNVRSSELYVSSELSEFQGRRATGPPILLALGGGHYQPRATDLARKGRAAFAHMLPRHHLARADPATVGRAIAASPGATGYWLDERDEDAAVAAVAVMHDHGLVRFE